MKDIVNFLIQHNETIITVALAGIILLAGVSVYFMAFGKKSSSLDSAEEIDRIEKALEKIMGQMGAAPGNASISSAGAGATSSATSGESQDAEAASASTAAPGTPEAAFPDMEKLKKELDEKTKELSEVKAKVESSKEDDKTPELLAKIKNLEEKLAEYEIIEDDIADLSMYKEENQKLKKELESLKGEPSSEKEAQEKPAEEAAEESAKGAQPEKPGEKQAEPDVKAEPKTPPVEEKDKKTTEPKAQKEVAGDSPQKEPPQKKPDEGKPKEEKAGAPPDVEIKAKEKAPDPEPVKETPKEEAKAAPAPEPEEMPKPEVAKEIEVADSVKKAEVKDTEAKKTEAKDGDAKDKGAPAPKEEVPVETDVFSEFDGEKENDDPLAELGDIDTDKMLEEIKSLGDGMEATEDVLSEELDLNKVAEEAKTLPDKKD